MRILGQLFKKTDKIQLIGVIIYILLLLILMNGCAIDSINTTEDKEQPIVLNNQIGYYWRDHYNHRYSNAPPVLDFNQK